MGYNKSIQALRRVQAHLEYLSTATDDVSFNSDDATKLARHLFEGIKFAENKIKNDAENNDIETYKKYAALKNKYIIRVKENKVHCELRDGVQIALPMKQELNMSKMILNGVTDYLEVIGAVVMHRQDQMHFPDFNDWDELTSIYHWSTANGYYIISHQLTNQGVTLTKTESDMIWRPSM
jgi:hypothetical protein